MNKESIFRSGFCFALFSLSVFLNTFPQGNADNLLPIGSYAKVSGNDGEHADGHQIILWRVGNKLVGELTYWDSNIEGQQGDFKDGSIDPNTSDIQFRVTVERHDTDPKEYSTASFKGRLNGTLLVGRLQWEGEAAEWRGENGIEKLRLPKEAKVKLLPFRNMRDWEEARYKRYQTR